MTDKGKEMDDLELLFAQARAARHQVPAQLTQRILAQADDLQAGFAAAPARAERRGSWTQFLTLLGGWPTMGGLAAACAAGVWIGWAPPSFLPDPAEFVTGRALDIDLIGMDDLAAALPGDG